MEEVRMKAIRLVIFFIWLSPSEILFFTLFLVWYYLSCR